MSRKLFVTSIALILTANTAVAGDGATELKQGLVFGGLAAAGAAIGGPVGMMVGGVTGAWLAENVAGNDNYKDARERLQTLQEAEGNLARKLKAAEARNVLLADDLTRARAATTRYEQLAADYLSFQVLFHTGDTTPDPASIGRIAALAEFIAEQTEVGILLSGHADPRGGEDYNQNLSQKRAESVIALLEAAGVSRDRISSEAFGDRQSTAGEGDLDAYALERRVTIDLIMPSNEPDLASTIQR